MKHALTGTVVWVVAAGFAASCGSSSGRSGPPGGDGGNQDGTTSGDSSGSSSGGDSGSGSDADSGSSSGADSGSSSGDDGGVCTPGAHQCSGNGVQWCDATGSWGSAVSCGSQMCVLGTCCGGAPDAGSSSDAGGCLETLAAACQPDTCENCFTVHCDATWSEAKNDAFWCGSSAGIGTCGGFSVIFQANVDVGYIYYYDTTTGDLVAVVWWGPGKNGCGGPADGFEEPTGCCPAPPFQCSDAAASAAGDAGDGSVVTDAPSDG